MINKEYSTPEQINGSGVLHRRQIKLNGTYFNTRRNKEGFCSLKLSPEVDKHGLEGEMRYDPHLKYSSYSLYVENWGS